MATYNGQPVTHKGHHGGRYDDPHGVTSMYRYSAQTRNASPITKEEYDSDVAQGNVPKSSAGSKASSTVTNSMGQAKGEGAADVRSKYRESRKAGMSPDDARGTALSPSSYPASGPKINPKTDYKGNSI